MCFDHENREIQLFGDQVDSGQTNNMQNITLLKINRKHNKYTIEKLK